MGKKRFAAFFSTLRPRARTLDMSLDAQGSVLVSRSRQRQCTSSGTPIPCSPAAFLSLCHWPSLSSVGTRHCFTPRPIAENLSGTPAKQIQGAKDGRPQPPLAKSRLIVQHV